MSAKQAAGKIRRSKVIQQAQAKLDADVAARANGHCGGETCMASRDAQRGGKQGTSYPCLCKCPLCTKVRREHRGDARA